MSIDLTRPWKDGGRDGLGKYRIGTATSDILVDFALEAKCKSPESGCSSGVKALAKQSNAGSNPASSGHEASDHPAAIDSNVESRDCRVRVEHEISCRSEQLLAGTHFGRSKVEIIGPYAASGYYICEILQKAGFSVRVHHFYKIACASFEGILPVRM